eukprot:gb/GECG01006645.1/.p1 GENE.gb/GECG01006645.1/~~gb/GECG01006645.1/.p1  ORF type:complete len:822 (+),score=137.67 gb/GECG01006645.1/:1-2466(+)
MSKSTRGKKSSNGDKASPGGKTEEEGKGKAIKECLQQIRDNARQLYKLKQQPKGASQESIAKEASHGIRLFSKLKQINRDILMENEAQRENVGDEKQYTDDCELQLENLQYEEAHLHGEIRKCTEFPMPYFENTDLVSEKEMLQAKPETKEQVKQLEDFQKKHKMLIERLQHELELRQAMEEKITHTKGVKSEVEKQLEEKNQLISSLPEEIEKVEQATLNLQKQLGMESTQAIAQAGQVKSLPRPLFVLFRQMEHAKQQLSQYMNYGVPDVKRVVDKIMESLKRYIQDFSMSVDIQDSSTATIQKKPTQFSPFLNKRTNESDSAANNFPRKRRKMQHQSHAQESNGNSSLPKSTLSHSPEMELGDENGPTEESLVDFQSLFKPAEKCVVVQIKCRTSDASYLAERIRFQYLPALEVVTVECLDSSTNSKLSNLYPGDSGIETPTLLHRVLGQDGTSHLNELLTFPDEIRARPFHWAQWLCGIYSAKTGDATEDIVMASTLDVLHRMIWRNINSDFFEKECNQLTKRVGAKTTLADPIIPFNVFTQRNSWEPENRQSSDNSTFARAGAVGSAEMVDFCLVSKGSDIFFNTEDKYPGTLESMTTLDDYFSSKFDFNEKRRDIGARLLSFVHSVETAASELALSNYGGTTSIHVSDEEEKHVVADNENEEAAADPTLQVSKGMIEHLINSASNNKFVDWRFARPKYVRIAYRLDSEVVQMLLQIPSEYPVRLPRILFHRLPPNTESYKAIWLDDHTNDVPGDLRHMFKKFGDDLLRETISALRKDEGKQLHPCLLSRFISLVQLGLPTLYKAIDTRYQPTNSS